MAADNQQQEQPQGNIRQEYNVARIGLDMDNSVNQIQKGKLTYALNASIENFDANTINYQNEPGNELCLNLPTNYQVIGNHFIGEQNKHIFFLVNPDSGDSEIGYMNNNDCIYYTYINSKCLNFNIYHPIHKVVHKITNCTTEIYWTDGLNSRRFLDLNNLPYLTIPGTNTCDAKITTEIDCNKLKVQPNFTIPYLTPKDVITGGELVAGTYQFAIQYCAANGDGYTSYYSVTNPTPIVNIHTITADFNYTVGKSIVLDITNIDTTGYFTYYNLAVIKTVNGISSVELVGTYFIDNAQKEVIYTGQNQTAIKLTINDIFEKFPYYDVAQDLTTVQDILIWDQLITNDRNSYQKIANNITLKWESYRIPNTENYANEINATNLRGYLRDEIYAYEICFLLDDGKQTDGFHIPGRIKGINETSQPDVPNTNPDFIGNPDYEAGGVGYSSYWKIYNTASVIGFSPEYAAATDKTNYKGPYQYGEFAYWESTETYPCNTEIWGELADKPIRHHKFPDVLVSPIFENPTIEYNADGTYKLAMVKDAIFPIGIRADVQQISQLIYTSNLTDSQKASIVGFKILRGDRSTNKSIVAKGILRNVGKYTRDSLLNNSSPTYYYFPNYPYNDLREDPFLLNESNAYNSQCITYKISNVIVPGDIQYTDCINNIVTTKSIIVGDDFELCSLSVPIPFPGSLTKFTTVVTSYDTYTISTTRIYANFEYTDPTTAKLKYLTLGSAAGQPQTTNINSTTVPTEWYPSFSGYSSIIKISNGINTKCYPKQLNAFNTDESKYRHVFNSPETSFAQPFLGNVLKLENIIYGAGKAHFVQVKKHALYKFITKEAQTDALNASASLGSITSPFSVQSMFAAYQAYLTIYINGITRRNFTYSYNSIASFDYYSDIFNSLGQKQRELDLYQYLISGVQSVGEDISLNNYNRESSVYLKTDATKSPLLFPSEQSSLQSLGGTPLVVDKSRNTISGLQQCSHPEQQSDISSVCYYGSIKNIIVNQWGQTYSYDTIDTGFQQNVESQNIIGGKSSIVRIFGGDTFINRFAFKTKLPFFIDNRVNAPDDSDVYYDELGNVAFPQYWFSSRSVLNNYTIPGSSPAQILNNIISTKDHFLDCPNTQSPAPDPTKTPPIVNTNRTYYDGKMYLFAYGIPSFYCESSINVNLRQAFNNREGDFFPHVGTGIPDDWLQESFVPIAQDNTYYYNTTYSKQNKENYFSHLPINWTNKTCYTSFPFRAIYSDPQKTYTNETVNNWLIYRPISFFDFPQNYGPLTGLNGIENKAVVASFENKSFVYNTMLTIQTSNPQAAYLGNDTLFKSAPPVDFAETDLGYVGSQHKLFIRIPQGQIIIDAKRGQVFLIDKSQYGRYQANDLSGFGSGLQRFFTDHLAFEILRFFPTVPIDNAFTAIGLHGVYDSKYDRVIISKLDYIPQSNNVKYDESLKEFYIINKLGFKEIVSLTDSTYFCNKSWTLSYNINTKSWTSFHSYIPNWYIAENNFFYSGINEGCDLEAVALYEGVAPVTTTTSTTSTTTTTTTTTTVMPLSCNLIGTAAAVILDCTIEGTAIVPSILNYSQIEQGSPYVDTDLAINGITVEATSGSGSESVNGGSTVIVQQNSKQSDSIPAYFLLSIYNETTATYIYNNIVTWMTSGVYTYQTIQSYSFTAVPGNIYTIKTKSYTDDCTLSGGVANPDTLTY